MSLKSWFRERLIAAVQYAVREEMNNYMVSKSDSQIIDQEIEDRIVSRVDKRIEQWTWERYKRTNRLFEELDYELDKDLVSGLDHIEKRVEISNKKYVEGIKEVVDEKTKYWTARRFDQTDKQIERWTWERYKRSEDKLLYVYKLQNQISEVLFLEKKVPYVINERIRIVFLFQVASFWPSWDSFYRACIEDERLDVKLLFLDEHGRESVQMNTARDFLETSNMDYIEFENFNIEEFKPHIIVIQTPYDAGHRIKAHWSSSWKAKGYRVVYVPYGIEISDTNTSRAMHFEQHVVENAWRIYTFNNVMMKDYRKYCVNASAVRALGLPKFDALYNREHFQLSLDLKEIVAGRPICLWKVHFPKIFEENGKDIIATPDINEYIRFAEYIEQRKDIFFIFMPHPRFREPVKNKKLQALASKLMERLYDVDNVFIDQQDDYRSSLLNADFIIVDRSAVMVEAVAVGVPILYMINPEFEEPVTDGIKPIIDSYYKGITCDNMIEFIDNCVNGIDEKKLDRESAFKNYYPYFDGKAGERIKNDIINSILEEG